MNAVEIEQAVSDLAAQPFDAADFPFQFLAAFGKKDTQLKRLRKGDTNRSDVLGGVLLQTSIHMAMAPAGETRATLELLKASPKTLAARAKFVLATDGMVLEAEDLNTGEAIAPDYERFAEHIGFFLPLAGISTVREIKDNPIDVRATGRLNKLYVELLRQNPDWSSEARRHDMNHFMARLIFCFFAEDTDIFLTRSLFTNTIEQFSESDGTNTHLVLEAVFAAMDRRQEQRNPENTPAYAVTFPYVNGGLFAGSKEVPRFTRLARSYLLQAGSLDWKHINPDIFGSMIQAVADDEERGALGMHYTSVPNILKVLNPLFLDELRSQLAAAGDNGRMLLNLRRRLSRIRVFDPACGSGNFLVIAYKEMRRIEAGINARRGEHLRPSDISKKNFRGIEIRDFAAEIARLALVIAEYQCDVLHRGPLTARENFLPLDEMNWITCGNALRLDWLQVCPPEGKSVKLVDDDLFQTPLEQPEIKFENDGGETYITGNPPYKGNQKRSRLQEHDFKLLFEADFEKSGLFDYVCGWFYKAFLYNSQVPTTFAFVATNSVVQGQHVSSFWRSLFSRGLTFTFAVLPFKWKNLASNDAAVTVVCIGASLQPRPAFIYSETEKKAAKNINAYLLAQPNFWVDPMSTTPIGVTRMMKGNYYGLSDHLLFGRRVKEALIRAGFPSAKIKRFYGATELTNAKPRECFWFSDTPLASEVAIPEVGARLKEGSAARSKSKDAQSNGMAKRVHQFREMRESKCFALALPVHSSEHRNYYPVTLLDAGCVTSNACFTLYDAPLWNMALIASKLHLVWIATVCGKLKTDFRYSNTLGWNTFPVPTLTEQNKADLTRCAEDVLLAREAHFPATIADLYDPETMPANLRAAHEANDEVLERIYIGRRFRNDTERLETLFAMYAEMTAKSERRSPAGRTSKKASTKRASEVQV